MEIFGQLIIASTIQILMEKQKTIIFNQTAEAEMFMRLVTHKMPERQYCSIYGIPLLIN